MCTGSNVSEAAPLPEEISDGSKQAKQVYKWDIVWSNVILLGLMHIGAMYGFYLYCLQCCWQSHLYGKILGYSSALGITVGAHRLWCHKSFKANTVCQLVLMVMVSCTYQNSVYVWSRDHRLHHKHSETDADPHNASRGFFFSHMGWLFVKKHKDVLEKGKTIDMSDLKSNRIVMFQHKYYLYIMILGFALQVFIPCYFWNERFDSSFFAIFLYRYIVSVHLTWCINSFAHIFGNKPYDKNIGPTENQMMMYMGLGEGFHNYHHTFPWDYKAAEWGGDVRNVSTYLIDLFAYLGMATDRKTATRETIEKRVERTGDGSLGNKPPTVTAFAKVFNNNLIVQFKRFFLLVLYISLV